MTNDGFWFLIGYGVGAAVMLIGIFIGHWLSRNLR
jgi:hypothetical protein